MRLRSSTANSGTRTRVSIRRIAIGLTLAGAVTFGGSVHAGPIHGGIVSSPTSFTNACQVAGQAGNLTGLAPPYVTGSTDFATYTAFATHTSQPCNTGYASTTNLGYAVFTIDTFFPVTVDGLALWAADIGAIGLPLASAFNVYADADSTFGGSSMSPLLTSGFAPATQGLAGVYGFAATTAQYFHVQLFGSTPLNQVAVGELALRGLPEPGTLALAGLSLLGLGALQRRATTPAPVQASLPVPGQETP